MPKYKQYLDATVNLANAAAKDPSLAQRLDGFGEKSLAEQVKMLESCPRCAAPSRRRAQRPGTTC